MRSIIQCSSIVRLEAELERDEPIAVERMRENEEGASSSNAAGPRFSNLATILKLAEPNTDGMRHECQLPRFTCWHTQMPPAVKRVEPEESVEEKGGIRHQQTGISLPRREQHDARRLHRINGPNPESVIDQVGCRKGE